MRQLIITTLFFLPGLVSSSAQDLTVDTYCLKLKKPTKEKYFNGVNPDSIPVEWRTLYEKGLNDWGKLLSRFNEEPLINSSREVFRSITFGAFNDPKDVQVMRIEKRDNKVVVTVKLIEKLKDSTILVHRKILGIEVWDKFEDVANKYFISRPSYKSTKDAIHDGATTVFEGYLTNSYYYVERHGIEITDPDLQEINRFLFKEAGDIFGVNCKKNTREN